MSKYFLIYAAVLLVFGGGIFFILEQGRHLEAPSLATVSAEDMSPTGQKLGTAEAPNRSVWSNLQANASRPLSRLFVQLILIVLAARAMGTLFVRASQPAVIGEMLAGILLGPSLLGWIWPGGFHLIFPEVSLETPRLLSQIGVCLFLFAQGMELDTGHLRDRASAAVMVSHISIIFPFFLGASAALFLYSSYSTPGTSFAAFALFMGIAMSVTAFPVLARIIDERRLAKTQLGSTALTCAAVDDVTAWSLLALIVAVVGSGNLASAVLCIAVLLVFLAGMVFVAKPLLARWIPSGHADYARPRFGLMACVLAFMFTCALVTQTVGIHALFGSFLAGLVMPRHARFTEYLKVRIEDFSSVFLLPVFFAYTGLRTQLGLLNDVSGRLTCLLLIAVATTGKLGGTLFAARATGMTWRDSFSLGALMNTRGLMELIALNIGYDMGILSPRIFTMLILMALVTTFMTGPLLMLAQRGERKVVFAPEPA